MNEELLPDVEAAIQWATEQPTLREALSCIARYEYERTIKAAPAVSLDVEYIPRSTLIKSDTLFDYLFARVLMEWESKKYQLNFPV